MCPFRGLWGLCNGAWGQASIHVCLLAYVFWYLWWLCRMWVMSIQCGHCLCVCVLEKECGRERSSVYVRIDVFGGSVSAIGICWIIGNHHHVKFLLYYHLVSKWILIFWSRISPVQGSPGPVTGNCPYSHPAYAGYFICEVGGWMEWNELPPSTWPWTQWITVYYSWATAVPFLPSVKVTGWFEWMLTDKCEVNIIIR